MKKVKGAVSRVVVYFMKEIVKDNFLKTFWVDPMSLYCVIRKVGSIRNWLDLLKMASSTSGNIVLWIM